MIRKEYQKKRNEITQRLAEFSGQTDKDVFYELCFCVLTPQSNAEKCWKAVEHLKNMNFYKKPSNPRQSIKSIRFYNNKAKYLLEARGRYEEIKSKMACMKPPVLREWLVKNVKGLGYKEASHFLRNTGAKNLAILDRHILRNLKKDKVIKVIPESINKKQYLKIEEKFLNFSKQIDIPMDALDLLFWSMQTGKIFK